MTVWTARNNITQQLLLAVGCAVTGWLLIYFAGWQSLQLPGMPNEKAGGLLGLLLLVTGLLGVALCGRQSIEIDARHRRIVVNDSNLFMRRQRIIRFEEIASVGIGYLGRRSNGVQFYYLDLQLHDGEHYALFAPGRFYAGSSDRSVVSGWQKRLQDLLQAQA